MGGLGLTPLSTLLRNAFSASITCFVEHNFSSLLPGVDKSAFLSSSSTLASSAGIALAEVDRVLSSSSSSSDAAPKLRGDVKQRHLAAWNNKDRQDQLFKLLDNKGKARLSSITSKGANAWISAIPSSYPLLIQSHLFPWVVASYLGAPPPSFLPRHCLCGAEVDFCGDHFSLCPRRQPQQVHNAVVDCFASLANAAGHHCSPPSSLLHLSPDANIVADLRISSSIPSQSDIIIDVSLHNPCAPSSFSSSGLPVKVAEHAETAKIRKHSDAAASVHALFVPCTFETFGKALPKARQLACRLINDIDPSSFCPENWSSRTPGSYWSQRLSVTLSGGVAKEAFVLCRRSRCFSGF